MLFDIDTLVFTFIRAVVIQSDRRFLGLGTHLFVKVLRPGESEGNFSVFESSCHLLLPV